jgi:hypothetical protein
MPSWEGAFALFANMSDKRAQRGGWVAPRLWKGNGETKLCMGQEEEHGEGRGEEKRQ